MTVNAAPTAGTIIRWYPINAKFPGFIKDDVLGDALLKWFQTQQSRSRTGTIRVNWELRDSEERPPLNLIKGNVNGIRTLSTKKCPHVRTDSLIMSDSLLLPTSIRAVKLFLPNIPNNQSTLTSSYKQHLLYKYVEFNSHTVKQIDDNTVGNKRQV